MTNAFQSIRTLAALILLNQLMLHSIIQNMVGLVDTVILGWIYRTIFGAEIIGREDERLLLHESIQIGVSYPCIMQFANVSISTCPKG